MANVFDTIPAREPSRLVAGDLWQWRRDDLFADYPAPFFSLAYALRPEAGGSGLDFTAAQDGGSWKVSVAPEVTAPLLPGRWRLSPILTRDQDGARITLEAIAVEIAGNAAGLVAPDPRSRAERILAAIDAAIEGRALNPNENYTIEGRSLSRTPIADLMRLRAAYRKEVAAEKGFGGPRRRPVTFTR